jgi:hypothetical protein
MKFYDALLPTLIFSSLLYFHGLLFLVWLQRYLAFATSGLEGKK